MAKAKPKPNSGSRKGVLLWSCVILLAGGWLFFLGVIVGRGLVPLPFHLDGLEAELTAQRAEETAMAEARLKQGAQEGLPEEPLRIQDLRKPQVDAQVRVIPRTSVTGPDGLALKKRRVPPKKRPLPKAQSPSGNQTKATAGPPPRETVSKANGNRSTRQASPATTGSTEAGLAGLKAKFTLQVASVRAQTDAERIVRKLQKAGLPAYQTASPAGSGGKWYRVRVGAYETRKSAEAALAKFRDSHYKPIIIQR